MSTTRSTSTYSASSFTARRAPDPPAEYGRHLRPVGYTAGSVIVLAAAFLRGQAATRSSWCLEHEEGKT